MRNFHFIRLPLILESLSSSARVLNKSLPVLQKLQTDTILSRLDDTNARNHLPATSFHSLAKPRLLRSNPNVLEIARNIPNRTLTKYSLGKGKRKSVKAVLKRFYRLHWGAWIRTYCGRKKKLWKKSGNQKHRLSQHVFCNATQCHMLDKMVGPYWRKPRYYVDDIYEPYHTREEFFTTRTKPKDT